MGYRGQLLVNNIQYSEDKRNTGFCVYLMKNYFSKLPRKKFEYYNYEDEEGSLKINLSKKEAKDIIKVILKFKKSVSIGKLNQDFQESKSPFVKSWEKLFGKSKLSKSDKEYSKYQTGHANEVIAGLRRAIASDSKYPIIFGLYLG